MGFLWFLSCFLYRTSHIFTFFVFLVQIGFKNMDGVEQVPLTKDKAVQLVKDVFISAAERDVYTGDALQICLITKEGIKEEMLPLRRD